MYIFIYTYTCIHLCLVDSLTGTILLCNMLESQIILILNNETFSRSLWVCGFLRPKCCQFLFSHAFATDFCFERLVTRGTDSLPRDVQMRFCSSPTLNTSPENYKDVGLRYLASFHWHNPNIPICCCSSHRCILLTDLAPLKMGLNKLSNCIRFVAKICNSEQILYPAHISLSSAFQAKNE